jgi:hypothetical protein
MGLLKIQPKLVKPCLIIVSMFGTQYMQQIAKIIFFNFLEMPRMDMKVIPH